MRIFVCQALFFALVFAAKDDKVKLSVKLFHQEKCNPGNRGEGKGGDLLIDGIRLVGFEKREKDDRGRIVVSYKLKTPAGTKLAKGTFEGQINKPDAKVTSWEIFLFVRLAGSAQTPDFFYGFDPNVMKWSATTKQGAKNLYKDNPMYIGGIEADIAGKELFKYAAKHQNCDHPQGWIADHGIFRINKQGLAQNMYYDPYNGMFNPPL